MEFTKCEAIWAFALEIFSFSCYRSFQILFRVSLGSSCLRILSKFSKFWHTVVQCSCKPLCFCKDSSNVSFFIFQLKWFESSLLVILVKGLWNLLIFSKALTFGLLIFSNVFLFPILCIFASVYFISFFCSIWFAFAPPWRLGYWLEILCFNVGIYAYTFFCKYYFSSIP